MWLAALSSLLLATAPPDAYLGAVPRERVPPRAPAQRTSPEAAPTDRREPASWAGKRVAQVSDDALAERPRPNARGDYAGRTLWTRWRVVDSDPAGLNGRRHPDFPVGREDDISLTWPSGPVRRWPVVRHIPRGTALRGVSGNLGVIRLVDPDGATWQLVALPDGEHVFVRCNARFIAPSIP